MRIINLMGQKHPKIKLYQLWLCLQNLVLNIFKIKTPQKRMSQHENVHVNEDKIKKVKNPVALHITLISLVFISPSEAISWCVNTYLSHLDRAFSLGAETWIALGMTGCRTVPRSTLEEGLWSTHFSPPAERERRCSGRTGVDVYRAVRKGNKHKSRPKEICQAPCFRYHQLYESKLGLNLSLSILKSAFKSLIRDKIFHCRTSLTL